MSRLAPRSSHGLVSQAELRRHLVLAAGSAPLSTPSSAGSPARVCLCLLGTGAASLWSCYITASIPSRGLALQRAGAEAGEWRKEESLFSRHRRLPQSAVAASPPPPQHAEGGNLINSGQGILSAGRSGPALAPREHSTCQWPHTGHSFPKRAGLGSSPGVTVALLAVSRSAPSPPPAQEGARGRPLPGTLRSLEMPVLPLYL